VVEAPQLARRRSVIRQFEVSRVRRQNATGESPLTPATPTGGGLPHGAKPPTGTSGGTVAAFVLKVTPMSLDVGGEAVHRSSSEALTPSPTWLQKSALMASRRSTGRRSISHRRRSSAETSSTL
jgi:hypothetical protein